MRSLKAKLRPYNDVRPTPVFLTFDSETMTAGEAITAAINSGSIPPSAWMAVLPLTIEDRALWSQICQAEQAARAAAP